MAHPVNATVPAPKLLYTWPCEQCEASEPLLHEEQRAISTARGVAFDKGWLHGSGDGTIVVEDACASTSVVLGAAAVGLGIDGGVHVGHQLYGDYFYGPYDPLATTPGTRFMLCEGKANCKASGIFLAEDCARKASETSECAGDFIEFRDD